MSTRRLVWVTPERAGGIRSYADRLWPSIAEAAEAAGWEPRASLVQPPVSRAGIARSVAALRELAPDLIHVQHEYGLFGGKNPPGYAFPAWLAALRRALPAVRVMATAHTVLPADYRFPVRGRGGQVLLRALANRSLLPWLRRYWGPLSWGTLDGAIVHSSIQAPALSASGCPRVAVIPHYVYELPARAAMPTGSPALIPAALPAVLVFGYLTPEKGQELAIAATALLPQDVHLILAGGLRRRQDRAYLRRCRLRAQRAGIAARVHFTGFVPEEQVDGLYGRADLVLAPFAETSGSGSLAEALARGKAILAADLTLNRELLEREPECMALFAAGDAADCAARVMALLADGEARRRLGEAAARYARRFSAKAVAAAHLDFYAEVMDSTDRPPAAA